ncbi:glycosyltransferase family 2 protein [Cyanobium sp. FACHB-13342]|nr:glycosyltransferase family 2 protein [Cyanobium sp. FACHB-13342]
MTAENNSKPVRNLTVFYLCYNQWDIITESLLNLASGLSSDIISSVRVFICDDCSSRDKSKDLLFSLNCYPKLEVRIYRNSNNLGPGPSRNYLLSICNSSHFCFVDGDDAISAPAIHEFFNAPADFEIYQFPIILGSRFISTAVSTPNSSYLHWLYPRWGLCTGRQKLLFTSCSRIISSSFARKYSYCYGTSRRYEDILPYAICSIYAGSIRICLEPLIRARVSLTSGSRSVKLAFYRYLLESLRSLWTFDFPSTSFIFLTSLTLQSVRSVSFSYLRSLFHRQFTAISRK